MPTIAPISPHSPGAFGVPWTETLRCVHSRQASIVSSLGRRLSMGSLLSQFHSLSGEWRGLTLDIESPKVSGWTAGLQCRMV